MKFLEPFIVYILISGEHLEPRRKEFIILSFFAIVSLFCFSQACTSDLFVAFVFFVFSNYFTYQFLNMAWFKPAAYTMFRYL